MKELWDPKWLNYIGNVSVSRRSILKEPVYVKSDFSLARMPTNIGLTNLNSPSKLNKMYCEDFANSGVEAIPYKKLAFFLL